jgi:transposase
MKANADRDAEIIRLHHAERWPPGTIARELGVHASVVRRVLGQAGQVAESVAARPSMVEPYLPFIRETLAKHPKLRASRILEMVRGRGYKGQQSRFHEIIAELRPRPKAEAYLRLSTLPGEQWQVDWAHFGKLRVGRAERPLMAFVLVLSWSRRVYVRFFVDARMPKFLGGHVRAFDRLGGVPRVLLYDNLKSAVLERAGDAIRFHPTLLALAAHYRFAPRPCAPARGNEKGRVERAIRYLRESFFAARSFVDLADLNAQAEAWCEGPAMDRTWREDQARTVREAIGEEQPRLLPLPDVPFPCEEQLAVRVGKTPYLRFDLTDYSVPHDCVQRELRVIASEDTVRVVDGARIVARHARSYDRGRRIEDPAHIAALVDEKHGARQHGVTGRLQAEAPSSPAFLLLCAERGQNLGSTTAQLMRLLEGHGSALLEVALTEALARGVCHIPTLRHILLQHAQAGLVSAPRPAILHGDPRVASIIVRPHDLRDYDRLTTEDEEGHDAEAGS